MGGMDEFLLQFSASWDCGGLTAQVRTRKELVWIGYSDSRCSNNPRLSEQDSHLFPCPQAGFLISKPSLISRLEQGEELWVQAWQNYKEREIPGDSGSGEESAELMRRLRFITSCHMWVFSHRHPPDLSPHLLPEEAESIHSSLPCGKRSEGYFATYFYIPQQ